MVTGVRARAEYWDAVGSVLDPEVPVLSVVDLGIVRDIREEDGTVVVDVTPTYSGCPATEAIVADTAQSEEAFSWFRNDRADIDRHRDGLTLDGQGLDRLTLFAATPQPTEHFYGEDPLKQD